MELEIEQSYRFLDYRFHLTAVAKQLVRIHDLHQAPEGYTVAAVSFDPCLPEVGATEDARPPQYRSPVSPPFPPPPGNGPPVIAAQELMRMVDEWKQLARSFEQFPGHLDRILTELGPFPVNQSHSKQALYIGALINPLPGLGIAREVRRSWTFRASERNERAAAQIRPSLLLAHSGNEQLHIALRALNESITELSQFRTSAFYQVRQWVSRPTSQKLIFLLSVVALGVLLEKYLGGSSSPTGTALSGSGAGAT